jgi:mannose-6-phosphate isomerase-like protein (cupin superfamily)
MYTVNMKAVYVPKEKLDETLRAPALAGKHNLEPFLSFAKEHSLPFNILEDSNVTNDAEIHVKDGDLWQCLEGEVTFVCGGELSETWFGKRADGTENQNEIKAKTLTGGTEYILKPGDWLWIPAGEPHQHSTKGVARLIIIKIPR